MNLALDTNAYTALHRGDAALAEHVRTATSVGLPVIVLGELYFGFMNGDRLSENDAILDRFVATPRVRILHVTERTPRLFGEIATLLRRAGTPIQQDDIWIAALCKEHDFALATRDRGMRNVLGLRTVEF